MINSSTIHRLVIVLFGLFPILPNRVKGLPVIMLAIVSLYDYLNNRNKKTEEPNKLDWKHTILMSSIYIFYLLSLFNSSNFEVANSKLEIGLSLFIIPVFMNLSLNKWIDKRNFDFFRKSFLISLIIYAFIYFIFSFLYENEFYPKGLFIASFMRKTITVIPLIETHPIYASIFFGLGILFTVELYKKLNKLVVFVLMSSFSVVIIVLASKMVIIALIIILLMLLLKKVDSKRIILLILISTIFSSIALYLFVPNINSRFKELLTEKTYEKVDALNSSSIRFAISECSTSLILDTGLLGFGVGDVQDKLNSCYENKSEHLLEKQYNTHNQYLSLWLGTGILGLFSFLFILSINFRLAWINNDTLFLSILLFFSMNFLTENLLERQSGVILFAFLINFYGYSNLNKSKI